MLRQRQKLETLADQRRIGSSASPLFGALLRFIGEVVSGLQINLNEAPRVVDFVLSDGKKNEHTGERCSLREQPLFGVGRGSEGGGATGQGAERKGAATAPGADKKVAVVLEGGSVCGRLTALAAEVLALVVVVRELSEPASGSRSRALGYVTRTVGVSSQADSMTHRQDSILRLLRPLLLSTLPTRDLLKPSVLKPRTWKTRLCWVESFWRTGYIQLNFYDIAERYILLLIIRYCLLTLYG